MKLGEIQRYSYQAEYTTYEGDFGSSVDPDDDIESMNTGPSDSVGAPFGASPNPMKDDKGERCELRN